MLRGTGVTARQSHPLTVETAIPLNGFRMPLSYRGRCMGQGNFAHPDYEYLNRCAYFDYQRQRVYARTSSTLRKSRRKEQHSKNRMLRVSNHIEVRTSKCPCCGSTELQHRERKKQAKRAYDLVITTGSLKRKVIECRAPLHICVHCATSSCLNVTRGSIDTIMVQRAGRCTTTSHTGTALGLSKRWLKNFLDYGYTNRNSRCLSR